jgi:DNA-binding transcriptional ArsR family regulator
MDNKEKIKFIKSPPFEFFYAISRTAREKELIDLCKEHKINLDEEITIYLDKMKNNVSRFLKREMEYFFDSKMDTFGGFGSIAFWAILIENQHILTVEEMIDTIKNTDKIKMLSEVVKVVVGRYTNKKAEEICDWNEIKKSNFNMIELIKNIEIENEEFKEIILECLENPEETKERYCLMMKQFYEKAYKPIEKEILEKADCYREVYYNKFNENPSKFARQYLKANLENFKLDNKIYVSYFNYFGYSTWINKDCEEAVTVLGAFTDKYSGEERQKEKMQLLFKSLSDKKRIEIIYLLSDRPWYVYELAEKLKMSAATISYHLSLLQEIDIVQFERFDHRIYYSLDKEKFKELYENALENLLHD